MSTELIPLPLEGPYQWTKRLRRFDPDSCRRTFLNMKKKGLIEIVEKSNKKFIKITAKGQLKILLTKAKHPSPPKSWDGKWYLIMFDIPEASRKKRNHFRKLLKYQGFQKLQASVFISPQPINPEAEEYLKQTGLISYIRIVRAEKIDDDSELLKKFELTKHARK